MLQSHINPFSHLGQLRIFRDSVTDRGRSLLEEVFNDTACARRRLFTPLTTTWLFVLQVLEADRSCRQVLGHFVAELAKSGKNLCSLRTGGFCRARKRLTEEALQKSACDLGRMLVERQSQQWLWKGREVKIVDGTTLSMPDTRANQKIYPQQSSQKEGIGFPHIRMIAIFSLATSALLDCVIGRMKGFQSSELEMFRSLRSTFKTGDLFLFDRLYTSYADMAYLIRNDIDFVGTLWGARKFGKSNVIYRLGHKDWLVYFDRPQKWSIPFEDYNEVQNFIVVRILEVSVRRKGFRTRCLRVITTLTDEIADTKEEIANLYRKRWYAELDLRKIKSVMGMDVLRCQTPDMVRKEIWAHVIAYNLTCALISEAATRLNFMPNEISFAATVQLSRAFLPLLNHMSEDEIEPFVTKLLDRLVTERVGQRPDRIEPRALKRRPKDYPRLMKPRAVARMELMRSS